MNEEMKPIKDNDIEDIVLLLEGVKRQTYWLQMDIQAKRDSKGNVNRYKAPLVTKDFA